MTYSWSIVKLKTQDVVNADGVTLSDAVVSIQWIKTGVDDDGNGADVVGWYNPSADNVAEADFVTYADLTKETVVGWIESGISTELMDSYNDKIQEKIKTYSSVEKAIPWS